MPPQTPLSPPPHHHPANPSTPTPPSPALAREEVKALLIPASESLINHPKSAPRDERGGGCGEQVATDIPPTRYVLFTAGAETGAASQTSGRGFSPSCLAKRRNISRKTHFPCKWLSVFVWRWRNFFFGVGSEWWGSPGDIRGRSVFCGSP